MPRQSVGEIATPADGPGTVVGMVENGGVKTRPFEHVCNAYCRPDEGLCCEVWHMWRCVDDSLDVWLTYRDQRMRERGIVFKHGIAVELRDAPEVPEPPEEEWEAIWRDEVRLFSSHLQQVLADHAAGRIVYQGAVLYWFRNAFPSRREEEEVTTHG